jgi:hypothetical protein
VVPRSQSPGRPPSRAFFVGVCAVSTSVGCAGLSRSLALSDIAATRGKIVPVPRAAVTGGQPCLADRAQTVGSQACLADRPRMLRQG